MNINIKQLAIFPTKSSRINFKNFAVVLINRLCLAIKAELREKTISFSVYNFVIKCDQLVGNCAVQLH